MASRSQFVHEDDPMEYVEFEAGGQHFRIQVGSVIKNHRGEYGVVNKAKDGSVVVIKVSRQFVDDIKKYFPERVL
jgi:hypothetical protein